MAKIMNQSSGQSDISLMGLELSVTTRQNMAMNDAHQPPCRMEDTHTMGEAGMGGAGIDEFGETKLPDTAQALKRTGFDCLPDSVLELIVSPKLELNQIVQWVADSLRLRQSRHTSDFLVSSPQSLP